MFVYKLSGCGFDSSCSHLRSEMFGASIYSSIHSISAKGKLDIKMELEEADLK